MCVGPSDLSTFFSGCRHSHFCILKKEPDACFIKFLKYMLLKQSSFDILLLGCIIYVSCLICRYRSANRRSWRSCGNRGPRFFIGGLFICTSYLYRTSKSSHYSPCASILIRPTWTARKNKTPSEQRLEVPCYIARIVYRK